MKKLLILMLLMSGKSFAQKDTTVIEFEDTKTKKSIKIINNEGKKIQMPKVISFKSILLALDVDSTQSEKAWLLISKNNKNSDTLVVFNKNNMRFNIQTTPNDVLYSDEIRTFESSNGNIQTNSTNTVEFQTSFTTSSPRKYSRYFSKTDFAVYLGLNSYTNKDNQAPNQLSDLRAWPSRYIALSFRGNTTLSNSKKVHTVLSYAPEIAWHNFMLYNNNVLREENNQAVFVENTQSTRKSKFVVPHLMLPVMVNLGFKDPKLHVGVGGYVGYRIGGYTRERYNKGNDKTTNSFGLNDFKYGLTAEVGRKGSATLFIRYDLSTLFNDKQIYAQDMQAFSFGFRL